MTSGSEIADGEAYALASSTADSQRAKLPEWQRNQISDTDLQTGESWFVWGFYTAMLNDVEHCKRLLVNYLNNRFPAGQDTEKRVEEIARMAQAHNRLFDAVAAAGRQAYREGGDGHLASIANIFVNVIRNH